MNLKQKKLSDWFRNHQWSVENRGSYHAYLSKKNMLVTIDSVIFGSCVKLTVGDRTITLTIDELKKIAAFAEFCKEDIDDYRYQRKEI